MEITANPMGKFVIMTMLDGAEYGVPVKVIEDHFVANRIEEGDDENDAHQMFDNDYSDNDEDLAEYAYENISGEDISPHIVKLKAGEWTPDMLISAWDDSDSIETVFTVKVFGLPIGAMEGDLPPVTEEAA